MRTDQQGNIISLDLQDLINKGFTVQTAQTSQTPVYQPLNEKKKLFGKKSTPSMEMVQKNLKAPYLFDFKNMEVSGGSRGYDRASFKLITKSIEIGKPMEFVIAHYDGTFDHIRTAKIAPGGIKEYDLTRDRRDLSQYKEQEDLYSPSR